MMDSPLPSISGALARQSIEWHSSRSADALFSVDCPNCFAPGNKQTILRVPWPYRTVRADYASMLRCPACGCGFIYPAETADYQAATCGGESALAFYLQQGAGLRGIATNLISLCRPPGSRLLEIGCGFGLGLDFARRALAWDILGFDPSPFAAAGRVQLGLPIEPRYLTPDDIIANGNFDVVMASEVLEHVANPLAVLKMLWNALREGGTVILTTPDVTAAHPETAPGLLIPLLSIGYHLVLQSEASLADLIRRAGFVDVQVERKGTSLLARGNRGALRSTVAPTDGTLYRRYLRDVAAVARRDGDLWFGLNARAYREAVNEADFADADEKWSAFTDACNRRYGLNVDAGVSTTESETIEILATREPLCLGPMLYHRGVHRILCGESRSAIEPVFTAASAACQRLRRSLQSIGADDGDAEDVGWLATAEEILCAAERGSIDIAERLTQLGPAPQDLPAATQDLNSRLASYKRRAFTSLVNAGRLEDARRLADAVRQVEEYARPFGTVGAILGNDELDVLYCAAVSELQLSGGSALRALALLELLGRACTASRGAGRMGSAHTLIEPARSAEILALTKLGRHVEAADLKARSPSRSDVRARQGSQD